MKECDDCGDQTVRRKRCWHCGMFVCYCCWGHIHCCEPGHTKDECEDWKYIKQLEAEGGKAAVKEYLDKIRLEEMSDQWDMYEQPQL